MEVEEEEVYETFQGLIKTNFVDIEVSVMKDLIEEHPAFKTDEAKKAYFMEDWESCKKSAIELGRVNIHQFSKLFCWTAKLKSINKTILEYLKHYNSAQSKANEVEFSLYEVQVSLRALNERCDLYNDFGNDPTLYFCNYNSDSFYVPDLKRFCSTGKSIAESEEYPSSNTGKVEEFLRSRSDAFRKHFPMVDISADVSNAFVAVAAPSMEGKTQSAFGFKHLRALYFPLAGTNRESSSSQGIYINFCNHYAFITHCAKKDALKLPVNVSPLALKSDYRTEKFWTLGFFKALIEHAPEALGNEHWLEHFFRQDDFSFEKCSIADIEELNEKLAGIKTFFDGYCLFLDEFKDEWWNVFMRNLALAAGLSCIVCNTNTNITGLVGNETSVDGRSVWSLVVCKLSWANLEILDKIHGLKAALSSIHHSEKVSESVKSFLNNFESSQVKHLRPGIAYFIAKALVEFAKELGNRQNVCLLGEFLDFICDSLNERLRFRKPRLFGYETSFVAKIGMLYNDAFLSATAQELAASYADCNDDVNFCPFTNQRVYIDDHLFYVSNPTDPDNTMFCTFPSKKCLKVYSTSRADQLIDWKHQLTHMKQTELLTILASMRVSIFTGIIHLAKKYKDSVHPATLFIEACAAAVICESSRYHHQTKKYSFAGFDALNLAHNIIWQLMDYEDYRGPLKLTGSTALVESLKASRIPFLTSVNAEMPLNSIVEESFFVDRCAKSAEIDGRFDFKIIVGADTKSASCQCKSFFETTTAGELEQSLDKALEANEHLSFILTTRLHEEINKEIIEECTSKGICLCRVAKSGRRAFSLIEVSNPQVPLLLTALIFEVEKINELVSS